MVLHEELKEISDKDVVIIMMDGRGFRGKLKKFDDETLVLSDVFETSNQEVDEHGRMYWRRVLHSKLIVRIPMILRIWPWDAPSMMADGKKKKDQ